MTEQEKTHGICRERTPKVANSTGKEITVVKVQVTLRKERGGESGRMAEEKARKGVYNHAVKTGH